MEGRIWATFHSKLPIHSPKKGTPRVFNLIFWKFGINFFWSVRLTFIILGSWDISLPCTPSGHFKICKWKGEEFLFLDECRICLWLACEVTSYILTLRCRFMFFMIEHLVWHWQGNTVWGCRKSLHMPIVGIFYRQSAMESVPNPF